VVVVMVVVDGCSVDGNDVIMVMPVVVLAIAVVLVSIKFSTVLALILGGARSSGPGTGRSYKPRYSSSALDHSERRQNHRHTQWPSGRTGNSLGAHCTQRNLLQAALGTESEKVASACETIACIFSTG